ncbi:hypothetical protein BDZ90DRAFT_229394 [Jaminaea rosea]|uniref:DUF4211 domain-containing protein n=1 Tax=Jaminaea rosea TaxID=1569628 RepID=A0A316UZF6_9BASI|nr:hypothetical protein BDZ90DRAFT_229394 [Jaminaea rosea]PWN30374.1 hypothetical protein BDZ90DRAFT_229394 [Jaminaea rosea]
MDLHQLTAWLKAPRYEDHEGKYTFAIVVPPLTPELRNARYGVWTNAKGALSATPPEDGEEEDELASRAQSPIVIDDSPARLPRQEPEAQRSPSLGNGQRQLAVSDIVSVSSPQAQRRKQRNQSSLFRASDDDYESSSDTELQPSMSEATPGRQASGHTSAELTNTALTHADRNEASSSTQPLPSSGPRLTAQERARAAADVIRKQRLEAEAAAEAEEVARREEQRERKRKRKREKEEKLAAAAARARRKLGNGSDADDSKDDVANLRSNLNADAFVRATAPKGRRDFRSQLQKLSKARKGKNKQRNIRDSDDDDDEGGSSSDSSSSSSSGTSSSSAFVVSDDSIEDQRARNDIRAVESQRAGQLHRPSARRPSPSSRSLGITNSRNGGGGGEGPSASALSRNDALLLHGRLDLDEAASEFYHWVVIMLLSLPVSQEDEALMNRARSRLQSHVDDSLRLLSTQAQRRQFGWYLRHYPLFKREAMSRHEGKKGCAACHRKGQACEYRIILSGKPYKQDTLEWLDYGEDAEDSSDMSSNDENRAEHQHPADSTRTYSRRLPPPTASAEAKKSYTSHGRVHVFQCGSSCAERAEAMHGMIHWQYAQLNKVHGSRDFKVLKEKQARGGEITAEDVGRVARSRKDYLKGHLNWFRSVATRLAKAR